MKRFLTPFSPFSAAPHQTGECLGSGLPFGVRRRRRRFGVHRPVNSPPRQVRKVSPPPVTEALPHYELQPKKRLGHASADAKHGTAF